MARRAWRRALSLRLAVIVAAAQTLVVTLGLLVYGVLTTTTLDQDVEGQSVTEALTASVRAAPDGSLRIEPTAELREHLARNPSLQVAAMLTNSGEVLPGSTSRLDRVLSFVHDEHLDPGKFGLGPIEVAGRAVSIVVYADHYQAENLPAAMWGWFRNSVGQLAVAGIGLAGLVVFITRRALRPLQAAAARAERITMASLDERIDERHLPSEVVGFVRAINRLLDRLDAGVAGQRRFLANAAHEMRTPLTILKARIDTLPDAVNGARPELMRDVERLNNLVEQLLAVARLDHAPEQDRDHSTLDLVDAVRDLVGHYAPLAVAVRRTIAFEAVGPVPPVRAGRRAIESVVGNLIDNALRAEPRGGTVEVRVGPGRQVVVQDHGPGIAAEDRAAIFEPFWRGVPAGTEQIGTQQTGTQQTGTQQTGPTTGSGLGLSIARELAQRLGATIAVDDTPGGGARFRFAFVPA